MRLNYLAGAAVVALASPAAVQAQQITSAIQGTVRDASGAAIPGAEVVVTDTRTSTSRSITTNETGTFTADGLVTGGPYRIVASASGFEGQTVENIFTNLQGDTDFDFELTPGEGDIVVTGRRANVTQRAIGPGQSFGEQDLADFPSITRDIRDIIRIDPRVSLSRANEVDRISCLGGNDRSNTFTVDGIVQADVFGLNGTPFASRNALPIPFDAIRETSVEFAPFDVQYGAFTGCAINVVTKSGANAFGGSAFFTYAGDGLQGDTLDGESFPSLSFEEKRWGATLSGPILRDKLFFFFGYEETDLGDPQERGPVGAGFANELEFITEAQFNEISQVISDVYGIDTGGIARSLPETSRRFFGRVDWYLTDRQRLEATYQRLDEANVEEDDFNNTNITGLNTFELEGTKSNYYSLRLYSNWSDAFSTEIRASRSEVSDVQQPFGGGEAQSDNPITRIIVGVRNGDDLGRFQAGPGFSRTSNELDTEITQLKIKASLAAGDHAFTFGGEYNELNVFNLFGQNTTGTLTFANIADLREGLLSGGTNTNPSAEAVIDGQGAGAYGNFTASGDINDAAAEFTRRIFTVYAQDEWKVTPRFDLLAGVRIDTFRGDAPTENPNFINRYGFSNAVSFGRLGTLVLPRLGFTYNIDNEEGFLRRSQFKGGVGLFSGGDPTVYFSNAYSNNGIALGFGSTGNNRLCNPVGGRIDVVQNGVFTGLPQCVRDAGAAQSARGLADTQSIDPNFKTPTVLRANLSFGTQFGIGGGFFDDWTFNADYIYSRFRDPVTFVDLAQVVDPRKGLNGFTRDGRPLYGAIDPTAAGCDAELLDKGGSPPRYAGVTAACFNTSRDDEIQLTNGRDYNSHVASVVLSKSFDGGVFTAGGGTRFNLGYAFARSRNNRFNNGTTATGSFDGSAVFDLQDTRVATAEFETRHNATFALSFREKFFGDYDTQFGFTFIAREGRPYSYTFNGTGRFADEQSGAGQLLYVPSEIDDPNVVYQNTTVAGRLTQTAAQTAASLDSYIDGIKCLRRYRGRSIPRNTCRNSWFYDLDVRLSQELPGPARLLGVDDKLRLFADFDNFLNLIDSGANISRSRGAAINTLTGGVDPQGRYVYNNFNPDDDNDIQTSSSLWRVQVGVSYQF